MAWSRLHSVPFQDISAQTEVAHLFEQLTGQTEDLYLYTQGWQEGKSGSKGIVITWL